MGGGSDYYPFILNGIPGGGLAAGAGAIKSITQRHTFGGTNKQTNKNKKTKNKKQKTKTNKLTQEWRTHNSIHAITNHVTC